MLPVEVMPVARKPDVFERAVTPEEGRKLAQIARRSKVPVRMRQAVVVMASAQHQPVGAIAKLMQVSEAYVRQVTRLQRAWIRGAGPKMERGQAGEDHVVGEAVHPHRGLGPSHPKVIDQLVVAVKPLQRLGDLGRGCPLSRRACASSLPRSRAVAWPCPRP